MAKVKYLGIKDPENDESVLGVMKLTEKTWILARLTEYKGKERIDIRKWYYAGELSAWMPSKGISIEVPQLYEFEQLCRNTLNAMVYKGYDTWRESSE